MKKMICLYIILILLVGCNQKTNINYNTATRTVTCKKQLEYGFVEETFGIENGFLTTRSTTQYIPHKYYEDNSIDIEEALNQEMTNYQNAITNPPYSLLPPYDNGENIIVTLSITDYNNIDLFEKDNMIYECLTKDNKIIFDLYVEKLKEAWKANKENYSCSLN